MARFVFRINPEILKLARLPLCKLLTENCAMYVSSWCDLAAVWRLDSPVSENGSISFRKNGPTWRTIKWYVFAVDTSRALEQNWADKSYHSRTRKFNFGWRLLWWSGGNNPERRSVLRVTYHVSRLDSDSWLSWLSCLLYYEYTLYVDTLIPKFCCL